MFQSTPMLKKKLTFKINIVNLHLGNPKILESLISFEPMSVLANTATHSRVQSLILSLVIIILFPVVVIMKRVVFVIELEMVSV